MLFAGTFAFGVMLFSTIDGYVTDLLGYLLGNVLGIGIGDLVQVAVLGAIVVIVVLAIRKELLFATFDPLGAAASGLPVAGLEYLLLALLGITIVVSIQAVGIIMVVAMLVTPAATAQLLVIRFGRMMALAVALAVGVGGRGPVPELLPEPGFGGLDRPRRDAVLRARARARPTDRAAVTGGATARGRRAVGPPGWTIGQMTRLTWLGHATVLLETARPADPDRPDAAGRDRPRPSPRADLIEIDLPAVDAVLISHLHHDHLDLPSMRLLRPETSGSSSRREPARCCDRTGSTTSRSWTSAARRPWARRRSRPSRPDTADGGSRSGRPGRRSGSGSGGEHEIYFAGDTNVFPEMAELAGDLDLALIPVGGWGPTLRGGHMDPTRAAEALTLLRPRIAVAIHWGTLWPIGMSRVRRDRFEEPARRFIAEAARVAPSVSVPLLDPGDQLEIPARDVAVRTTATLDAG